MKKAMLYVLFICFLFTVGCGAKSREEMTITQDLEEMQQLVDQEVENLSKELNEISNSDEYSVISEEGKKCDPAKVLDYHQLIDLLEANSEYFNYYQLLTYMEEAGYSTADRTYEDCIAEFWDADYENQSIILAKMFYEYGSEEYEAVTGYDYTIAQDGNAETDVTAEANETEKRVIQKFIVRGIFVDEKQ